MHHCSSRITSIAVSHSGPEDPLNWLRSLVSKALALGEWLGKTDAGVLLKLPVKLTELFRPDTFLNALRQQTARASGYRRMT